MTSILGPNAKKWMNMILAFIDDPAKYGLPRKIFKLPNLGSDVDPYLTHVKNTWQKIRPREETAYNEIEEKLDFWMVFCLSKRPATLFFAVWDKTLEDQNREIHQDLHYNFQELIQNFIREELALFKLVRPFRRRTGNSVLFDRNINSEYKEQITEQLSKFTSPQKVLHNIAYFARDKTIQTAIAYQLLIERFSVLINKTKNPKQVEKVTKKFVQEVARLEKETIKKEVEMKTDEVDITASSKPLDQTMIEFDKITLQEYDGYVEIKGTSEEEDRNFRIYNCIEEDKLREEMWKDRRYPIRSLVDNILEERYSRPTKKYSLAYGVDIEILDPNWLS